VIGGSCRIELETARRARTEGADVVLTGRNPRRGIGFRYRGEA
jgi:NAD(P)-dependent dehydrogenase (short-subunit alcohol dehydrogenase family)